MSNVDVIQPRSLAEPRESTVRAKTAWWSSALFGGVMAVVLWTPLAFGSVESWAIGIIRVAACALLIVWSIGGARSGAFSIDRSALQIPLYAAAGYALVQSVGFFGRSPISADPFSTSHFAWTLLAIAVLFSLMLVSLDRMPRLERAATALFWFGAALSVVSILAYLSGTRRLLWIRESPVVSFFGPFVNKNHFAGLIEILLPMGLGTIATGAMPRARRPLHLFAAIVMLTAVVLSRSRAGMLAVGVELVLVGCGAVIATSRRTRAGGLLRAVVIGGVLAASAAAAVVWLGSEPVAESIGQLPGDVAAQDASSRTAVWRATIELIEAHPILGSGLGAYGVAVLPFYAAPERIVLLYAHNDYLQVLADAGIVGALLAILFLVILGRTSSQALRCGDPVARGIALGAAVGCLGLLIHSVVDFNLQIPSNALAFLFATAMLARVPIANARAASPTTGVADARII